MTTRVEKSVTVEAPVSVVYNTWTQFEDFPLFMGGVQEVRQLGDSRLYWVAEIAGVKREWEATILEQVPDEKVAWAATEGATNAGTVRFTPAGVASTVVTLSLEYEPEGLVEKAGDLLSIVERRAEADMENFKQLMETGGREPGGWRGAINPDAGIEPGVEAAALSSDDSGKSGVSGKAVAAGVAAAAAVAAAGVAASKSGDSTDDGDLAPADDVLGEPDVLVVEPAIAEPVISEPVVADQDVVVDDPHGDAAFGTEAPQTYPVADDPAPFSDTDDDSGTSSDRTV